MMYTMDASGNSPDLRRRHPFLIGKVLLAGLVGYMALCAAAWIRWDAHAQADLAFERAEALRYGPLTLAELNSPRDLPEDGNAALLYVKAADAPGFVAACERTAPTNPKDRHPDRLLDAAYDREHRAAHPSEVRELLDGSREALTLARRARDLPSKWVAFDNDSFRRRFRVETDLHLLLMIAAADAHESGRDDQALEYMFDDLALADSVGRMRSLLGAMVSIRHRLMAALLVQDWLPAIDAAGDTALHERFGALARALYDDAKPRQTIVNSLLGERATVLDPAGPVDEVLRKALWKRSTVLSPAAALDETAYLRLTRRMIECVLEDRRPEPFDPKRVSLGAVLTGPRTMLAGSVYLNVVGCFVDDLTNTRRAGVALACRLFELRHGRRPQLEELAPEYLPSAPPASLAPKAAATTRP